jgi:hypothetical protein
MEKGQAAMSLQIRPETEARIAALAAASGVSVDDFLAALVDKQSAASNERQEPAKKPISARIREIWADMPPEVRAKLPADGASQHDHYIYGVPKRTL